MYWYRWSLMLLPISRDKNKFYRGLRFPSHKDTTLLMMTLVLYVKLA